MIFVLVLQCGGDCTVEKMDKQLWHYARLTDDNKDRLIIAAAKKDSKAECTRFMNCDLGDLWGGGERSGWRVKKGELEIGKETQPVSFRPSLIPIRLRVLRIYFPESRFNRALMIAGMYLPRERFLAGKLQGPPSTRQLNHTRGKHTARSLSLRYYSIPRIQYIP